MPGVVPPPRRPQRLAGLGGKTNVFKPIPRPAKKSECGCETPTFEMIDGAKVCLSCGTQVSEQNIVAEVTFGESSTGAATVEGGIVNENARHAKTLGAAAARRLGTSMQTREESENNGRESLRLFTARLPIPPDVAEKAMRVWKLATSNNFVQGRRADEVAGACLYAACRSSNENSILLMDIAEVISINVFNLGDIYKSLLHATSWEVQSTTKMIEIEPLIMKYASKLEFGDKTRAVAEDAIKIVRRMKRDWIVTGRHPAGLCGACLILAARMNNFRRTVREVVFVVKVADLTITSRLKEFMDTRSGQLPVSNFREDSHRIKFSHDPPSILQAKLREEKMLEKKRKRQAQNLIRESSRQSSVISEQETPEPAEATQAAKRQKTSSTRTNATIQNATQREPRRDADGFVIPEIPLDPSLRRSASVMSTQTDSQSASPDPEQPQKTKRKKKQKAPPPPPLTEDELLAENELQDEIENILTERECISSKEEAEKEKIENRAKSLAEQQRAVSAEVNAQRMAAIGRSVQVVSDSEIIGEDEFADDPEVANALLSEAQVRVKEMIWVAHNEDWLRAQQAKQLKKALEEAEGKPEKSQGRKSKPRGRMGDGSVLTEGGTPVESPADASLRMLEKRAPKGFSQRVNYAALGKIYGDKNHGSSRATSEASSTPAPESVRAPSEPVETEQSGLPTPVATQRDGQAAEPEKPDEEMQEDEENEEEEEDEGDYWPAEEQHTPHYEDEDDFDAAQEDMTGDFGIGDDEGDGLEDY